MANKFGGHEQIENSKEYSRKVLLSLKLWKGTTRNTE
jgi:hypothetical protein